MRLHMHTRSGEKQSAPLKAHRIRLRMREGGRKEGKVHHSHFARL